MKENSPLYQGYLQSQHPHLTGEPDHGLVLEPQDDADFRERAEKFGLDYDLLKRNFSISHQVISPQAHAQGLRSMKKNAVPLDALKNYFEGMIEGAILQVKSRDKAPL